MENSGKQMESAVHRHLLNGLAGHIFSDALLKHIAKVRKK